MERRLTQHDIESILERVRKKLIYKMDNNQLLDLEILDKEDVIILDIKTKKSVEEKKELLNDLAGSGLQHASEVINDAVEVAYREEEEDREDINFG